MAGKRIKGITIQLGADTSALDKALKDVDNTSLSLNTELKEINKLLKFDPGNTQLLAQKQKVLAQSIENTETKLDALKQAQSEVDKMFKNGDIGEKEYREFQRTIAETEQSLKSYKIQASKMKDEQEKLQKGTKQLNTFLEATGKTLDDFQDVLGTKLTNALKNGTANSDDLTVALNKIGKQALGAETDLSKMRTALDQVDDGKEIEAVRNELQQLKNKSGETEDALNGIGKGIVSGNMMQAAEIIADAGEKIKEFSDNAKEAFKEVDAGSDAIITATGATGKAAIGLNNVYKDIVSTLPIENLESIGKAIGEVNTQFAFTDKKLQSSAESILKFSEITGSDVVTSTQNAKQAISIFNLSGDDLGYVLDSVAKVAQDTGESVDTLFQKAIEGAPQLQELGLGFSESVRLLGSFEQAGVDGAATLSSLSKAAVNYAKDGKSLSEGLAEVQDKIVNAKDETEALNAASEVFGTKGAVRMVDAIKRGALNLDDLSDSAKNSQGTVERTFKDTLDAIDEETVATNNIKLAMADFGNAISEAVAPILEALVPIIQKIAKWFDGLSGTGKTVIVVIGAVAAIVAALLPVIAVVAGGITAAGGAVAFLTGALLPVIGVIAGVIAAIIAVVAVIKNWGKITDWLSDRWEQFKDWISGVWDAISEKISEVWTGIKDFFKSIWEAIYNTIEVPINLIKSLIEGIMYAIYAIIYTVWEVVKSALGAAWDWISSKASKVFGPLVKFFENIWDGIRNTVSDVWNSIKDTLGGIWDGIKSKATEVFSSIWKYIKDGFNSLKDTLGGIVKGIANGIIEPLGKAINGVINGVNWILDKVGSDKQFAPWEIPHFAKGAGGIKRDTIGVVNDQKGSVYKEMVVPPDGKPFIPAGRDVVLKLKKGTKIMPARQTKSLLESLPHFAGGIGDFFGGIWEGIKDFTGNVWDYITHPSKIVQIALDKFTDLSGIVEPWISVATGAVNSVFDGVVDFIKGIFDTQSNVNYNPTAGVEQWRSLAKKALQMEGQYSDANLERLLYQMQTESGGNPNAINNWDINAINGTPSKGLLQVIDPTFRAYARPGFDSNIWDPLSNMLASIRYAVSRYGSLEAAYRGVGYEQGIGDIDISSLFPNLPTLDVRWFKDGGILTKPALFNMGNGRAGGAGEAGAEAIAPVKKLKEYVQDAVLEVFGNKDINITMNITQTMDGREVAKQTVKYSKPLIEEMDKFQNYLKGVKA